jgi:hypothetical protein
MPSVVVEVAVIEVTPGEEDAFVAAYHRVRPEVAGTPGCLSVRMTRGVESPSRFVLLVEWGPAVSPGGGAGRAPHFAAPPLVEHYADVGAPAR